MQWCNSAFLVLGRPSAGLIPRGALTPVSEGAGVVPIAALGLCLDVRGAAKAGVRVILAAVASLLALVAVSLGLIHLPDLV